MGKATGLVIQGAAAVLVVVAVASLMSLRMYASGGRRVVGTWLGAGTITSPRVPFQFQGIMILHRDGTFQSSDVDDQGSFGPGLPSDVESPIYGTWKRRGGSLELLGLFIVYDRRSGSATAISKVNAEVAFPGQGPSVANRLLGSFSVVKFRLNQDPLDADEEPISGSLKLGTLELRRVRPDSP